MATAPVAADPGGSSAADRRASASASISISTESRSPTISTHAPFLHTLSQRFRRGSNVSSNTSDSQSQHAADKSEGGGGAGGGVAAPQVQQQSHKQQERARADASRAAKRYLMTIVRNDWEFDLDEGVSREKVGRPDKREPLAWRLRDDGSEDELDHAHGHGHPAKRRGGAGAGAGKSDPYRFESPDAVADYVRERQVKRRKVLHKQMAQNPGLKHWVYERDAWTGAVWKNPAATKEGGDANGGVDAPRSEMDAALGIILRKGDIPDSEENSTTNTRTTSANASNLDLNDNHAMDSPAGGAGVAVGGADDSPTPDVSASPGAGTSADSLVHTTTVTAATSTDPPAAVAGTTSTDNKSIDKTPVVNPNDTTTTTSVLSDPPDPEAEGPYIPVYPPLFPEDNVLRSRISPATYSTIYSKIVVQSLTPNIPIPLPDMVRALVHGWKTEGQWPPTGNAAENAAVAARKARGSGVGAAAGGAFARWRREKMARKGSSAGGEVLVEGPEGVVGGGGHHHRVRRSISSVVKRVIGKDEEERRVSEVGLTVGFEEDDEDEAGGVGIGDDDAKLNRALLVDEETARARAAAA